MSCRALADYRALIVVTYLYPTAIFLYWRFARDARCSRRLFTTSSRLTSPSTAIGAARAFPDRLTDAERRLGFDSGASCPVESSRWLLTLPGAGPPSAPSRTFCIPAASTRTRVQRLFDYSCAQEAAALVSSSGLTGKDDIPVPDHPDIEFPASSRAEEKFQLMAGALCYVMPSGKESFSIRDSGSDGAGTPALVSGASEVADHVRERRGRKNFTTNYQSFAVSLDEMLSNQNLRERMGAMGENTSSQGTRLKHPRALVEAVRILSRGRQKPMEPEDHSVRPTTRWLAGPVRR